MKIKVLGSGCTNCKKLEDNVMQALTITGIDATVEKIEDYKAIIRHGVMKTPALVIDDRLKFTGRVATVDDIMRMINSVHIV